MRKLLICLGLSLFCSTAFSQNKIDSLENLVAHSGSDSLKLIWYDQLRRIATYTDPEKAVGYINKRMDIFRSQGNMRKVNVMKVYLGNIYYTLSQPDKALGFFISAEKYFSGSKNKKDQLLLGNIYNGMAAAHETSGNDTITLKYFTKSYEQFKTVGDARRMGIALNNIANIYVRRKDYPEAVRLIEEGLGLLGKTKMPEYKILLSSNLAGALKEQGDYQKSDSILLDIIPHINKEENAYGFMAAQKNYGENQLLQGNFERAIIYLEKAKQIAVEQNFTIFREEIHHLLYLAYKANKQAEKALSALYDYTVDKDSVYALEKDRNLTEAMQKYESEKREKELAQTQLALKTQSLQKKNFLIISVAAGLLALVSLWFLYFKSKTNRVLKTQKETIENALREKEVLLKEIHHRVKNNLQVISSLLNLQSRSIIDEQAKAAIKEGQNRVKSMGLIHQSLYQTDIANGMEIGDYIGQLGKSLFDSYNIKEDKIKFAINAAPLRLDVDTLIPIGLILNELLSNALKHAFPDGREGEIKVNFEKKENALLLQVKDNGVGMSITNPDKNKNSFGMQLIKAFSKKLNANMEVVEKNGTLVNVFVREYKLL
ncbi:MAG TPA: tetratricopeptide repeat protein [Bacteroidetes bacterium]|nr:tetratricopeptide repeat protein [Bacteroidota bacterium]